MVAIGIDLGTTYSCVGWWKDNRCDIIANDQGNRTTPSYVAFTNGERLIGDGAKNQASINPENTIYDAKRLIGRKFDEKVLQNEIKQFPFTVKEKDSKPFIETTTQGNTVTQHSLVRMRVGRRPRRRACHTSCRSGCKGYRILPDGRRRSSWWSRSRVRALS